MTTYFTKEQLTIIFELQCKANSAMSDAWLTSTNSGDTEKGISAIPYYRAAVVEAFEAIAHLGFKWWKKEIPNVEQAVLELVDILHFTASESIRAEKGNIEDAVDFVLARDESSMYANLPIKNTMLELEFFAEVCLKNKFASTHRLLPLFVIMGQDATKIYNMYVGKNVLNLFRTANGQRNNTYVKIWSGREDNLYLEKYFQTQVNGSIDPTHLENWLTKNYKCYGLKHE